MNQSELKANMISGQPISTSLKVIQFGAVYLTCSHCAVEAHTFVRKHLQILAGEICGVTRSNSGTRPWHSYKSVPWSCHVSAANVEHKHLLCSHWGLALLHNFISLRALCFSVCSQISRSGLNRTSLCDLTENERQTIRSNVIICTVMNDALQQSSETLLFPFLWIHWPLHMHFSSGIPATLT